MENYLLIQKRLSELQRRVVEMPASNDKDIAIEKYKKVVSETQKLMRRSVDPDTILKLFLYYPEELEELFYKRQRK